MEWQAARAANHRSLVMRTVQACLSWPAGESWSAAFPLPVFAVIGAGFLADSTTFPQGSLWRERPPRGGVSGGPKGGPLTPPRWRTSAKKRGVAPSTSSPSGAAPRRAVRGGDAQGRRRTALCPGGLGESVPTRFQCGFPGTTWTTAGRALPSESGTLGLLRGRATTCATSVRHPSFGRWPPI